MPRYHLTCATRRGNATGSGYKTRVMVPFNSRSEAATGVRGLDLGTGRWRSRCRRASSGSGLGRTMNTSAFFAKADEGRTPLRNTNRNKSQVLGRDEFV